MKWPLRTNGSEPEGAESKPINELYFALGVQTYKVSTNFANLTNQFGERIRNVKRRESLKALKD